MTPKGTKSHCHWYLNEEEENCPYFKGDSEVKINLIELAKRIKDDDAREILKHPEDFPEDWVIHAKERLGEE